MVRVGTVYKSNGMVDLSTLSARIKLSVFVNYMIDNSYILSGNREKMAGLEEDRRKVKVEEYTQALVYYLEKSSFRNQEEIPFTFDVEDMEFVKIALTSPLFFMYKKSFVQMEHNLMELAAFKIGIVIIRRLDYEEEGEGTSPVSSGNSRSIRRKI